MHLKFFPAVLPSSSARTLWPYRSARIQLATAARSGLRALALASQVSSLAFPPSSSAFCETPEGCTSTAHRRAHIYLWPTSGPQRARPLAVPARDCRLAPVLQLGRLAQSSPRPQVAAQTAPMPGMQCAQLTPLRLRNASPILGRGVSIPQQSMPRACACSPRSLAGSGLVG